MLQTIIGILFLLSPTPAVATTTLEIKPVVQSIRDMVLNTFPDDKRMLNVAKCESRFRQFNEDGSVLRGLINNKDIGIFQTNEKYWLDTANKLGYNIYTVEGNIKLAKYIYDKQGISAWEASRKCWDKG